MSRLLASRPAAIVLFTAASLVALRGSTTWTRSLEVTTPVQDAASGVADTATASEVQAACGGCHTVPPPEILPRAAWRNEIVRMMLIRDGRPEPLGPVGTSTRMIPLSPDMLRILRYYQQHAPAQLAAAAPWPEVDAKRFKVHAFTAASAPALPAISHVAFVDLDNDGQLEIAASDMRQGLLVAGRATDPRGRLDVVGRIPNPAHFRLFDFDGDGLRDLLIADLGSFQPEDHTRGAVMWMRRMRAGPYGALRLDGWPRVSDVEPADFNGDGRPDLVVAAFGWRKVGQLTVLENTTSDYAAPSFVPHVIDPRSGSIHAIPVDLNGDGRLDIVALFAQQYETVVAYLNAGDGFTFTPHVLYTAPHPNWGSSGIEVVDIDGDKDLDVIMTRGDTFDDQIVKPYHGIQLLENAGSYPFVSHDLAALPGALRAQAGDLDGDGDLDIVACAFIADAGGQDESGMASLVWLEQTERRTFRQHTLERRPPRHATLDLADIDGDGDLDIAVGNFLIGNEGLPWVEVWENTIK